MRMNRDRAAIQCIFAGLGVFTIMAAHSFISHRVEWVEYTCAAVVFSCVAAAMTIGSWPSRE